MKLDAFRFRHVGPFGAEGVEVTGLVPGLNVIAEHNERGKSSLLAALETVLFLPHTSWRGEAKSLSRDDGPPMGEIDFTVAGAPYRLSKTFRTGKTAQLVRRDTGELIARKREAEERVADMLGLGTHARGPSGLLWVRQGNSMEAAQDDGQVASRLESEMSTLVGGERARAYLERTEAELGKLLTPKGRVKTSGPLAQSEDALATTEAQLERAEAAALATRQMGLDLQAVRARIASLGTTDDAEADAQIAAARKELDAARLASGKLDVLRANAQRRAGEDERAQEKLGAHLLAVQAHDAAVAEMAELDAQLETARTAATQAQTLSQNLAEELSTLSAQREAAARSERMGEIAARASERNAALQAVIANLQEWDTEAARRAERVSARDALPPVTRDGLERLNRLERDRDAAVRELSSLQASLKLALDPGTEATLDGKPIGAGPVRLSAASVLQIGRARLRLDAPEADTLREAAASAASALDAQLERLEVGSADEAANVLRDRGELDADIALLDRQLALIAPDGHAALVDAKSRLEMDVEQLRAQLDGYSDAADDPDFDPVRVASELTRVEGERRAAATRAEELRRDVLRLELALEAQTRMVSASPEGAKPGGREAEYAALSAAAALAREQWETAKAELETAASRVPTDPALIEARLGRLQKTKANRDQELNELEKRAVELSASRGFVFEDRDPEAEAERLSEVADRLREDVARHRRRADALTLLRDTLRDSQSALQARYTAPVRAELAPLLSRVITGAEAELSEQLGTTALRRGAMEDPLERLSGGTREQIAVLTRLAFARLLARGGQPCPVILDDALVYADDGRRAAMFDVLNYVAQGDDPVQLLYLSCHERAARELGGERLTLRPWMT